jgi:Kef-type K+ transport system membrane component KefB
MDIFVGLSLTIVIAALIAGILQKLKQPLIIGHIITGLIVGPFLFKSLQFQEVVDSLSQFGIALLLFIIGLNLTPKVIKEVGKVSLLAGLGQILLTSSAGFLVCYFFLHFNLVTSIYVGMALTFSSTIIIMKLLSDKRELSKFYSKISIGLLLVQDLIVAIILIAISAFSGEGASVSSITLMVIKGIVVFDLIILFTIYIVPMLSASFAKSQEFLFLFSIGWGLGLATLFHYLGFSMEIGALIAGVSLSTSTYHFEISSRLRPLRDFFIILFFILLGSKIKIATLPNIIYPALFLSLFVIVIKPLLVLFLTGVMGYRKKINFFTAINFTQVSEFSLILLMLAQKVSGISSDIISLITLVSLITIAVSSYIVLYGANIYPFFQKFIYERKVLRSNKVLNENYDVILFGCNRMGGDFLELFGELGKKFLVIDFDPEKIKELEEAKITCRYGDADDNEFLEELNLGKTKMVISTIPDFETNQFLIGKIKAENPEVVVIVISHDVEEAIGLYESGATYVITPHFLGGKYASMLISKFGFDLSKFVSEKEKHIKDLEKKKEIGKTFPLPEIYR